MASGFDSIAVWYRFLERAAFLGALQRCRLALLDRLPPVERVLMLGEGDGRFLECFRQRHPHATVTVLDASRRMLELAATRVRTDAGVRFVHGDARDESIRLPAADLIITLFFLDCFEARDQARLIERGRQILRPGGGWLWADFNVPDPAPMRWIAHGVVRGLYAFFRLTTHLQTQRLHRPQPVFQAAGLNCATRHTSLGGLLATEFWRLGPSRLDFPCEPPDPRRP